MPLSLRVIVLLLTGLAAVGCDRQKPDAPQAPASPTPARKGVDRTHAGQMAPAASIGDPAGAAIGLGEFGGKPLLVNLWASWCAPCVKELPTLEALAASSGDALQVVAISQDDGPRATVDAFLAEKKIGRFAAYQDKDMALMTTLGVQVLPTTILYDAAGKEVWRYTGDLDWTGAEARALLAEASPATAR